MSNLNLVFSDSGFPDPFVGDTQDEVAAWAANLGATVTTDTFLYGAAQGSAPAGNIGPGTSSLWLNTTTGALSFWQSAWKPLLIIIDDGSGHTLTLSSATLGASRTINFPDKSGTVAYTDDIYTPRATTVNSAAGATPVIDWSATNSFEFTLSANASFTQTLSQPGQTAFVVIKQPAGQSYTVAFPNVIFPNTPGLTQVATNTKDFFVFRNTAGTIYAEQFANMS